MACQVFLIDMLLSFITPFQDAARVWVTDPRKIATTYLRTWFFVDIMSIFPFEIIAIGNKYDLMPCDLMPHKSQHRLFDTLAYFGMSLQDF